MPGCAVSGVSALGRSHAGDGEALAFGGFGQAIVETDEGKGRGLPFCRGYPRSKLQSIGSA